MRLAKFLAAAGIASRRAAEVIVRDGRVTLGGELVTDPARDVAAGDAVTLDGEPVSLESRRVVYAVNKPLGVVCTARDPQGRRTIVSLVPSDMRLYPVGRLDIDSTGLILLTNDGELANRLTHPRFEVEKTYRAVLAHPPIRDREVRRLRAGVELEDGLTAPARVRRTAGDVIELTIHEGRKRQIRRMCEAVGHPVRRLQRVRIGGLELGALAPGAHRQLTAAEVAGLSGASAARPTGRRPPAARAKRPAGAADARS